MDDVDKAPPLFIKELIRRVHEELLDSRREREEQGQDPIFAVESMTLEVNFVASQSKDKKGGLDFRVITVGGVSVGGATHYEQEQVHKVTLNLTSQIATPNDEDDDGLVGLSADGTRFLPRLRSSGW